MQFDLVQGAFGIPQFCGLAFGHDLEPVVPGPLAQRAQRAQARLIEVHQRAGFVCKPFEFHNDS